MLNDHKLFSKGLALMIDFFRKFLNSIWRPRTPIDDASISEAEELAPFFDDEAMISKSEAMPWERDENESFH